MYHLFRKQLLPISLEQGWAFFSDPYNLKTITPPDMGFEVLSFSGKKEIHSGQIIIYSVKPLMGVPVKWVTEITQAEGPFFFVDEQRSGPFSFWHHKHYLKSAENGVEMIDSLHYKMPFGWLGKLVHQIMVKRRLEQIFDFREKAIRERFGKVKE
ncbi:MAG: SRPBCC family protein [Bacteroides sp.]|jgi:ligand-binding SRPBCC domain-containing protein|nr:SRPBCC family protein [Bacteroides sp.]